MGSSRKFMGEMKRAEKIIREGGVMCHDYFTMG